MSGPGNETIIRIGAEDNTAKAVGSAQRRLKAFKASAEAGGEVKLTAEDDTGKATASAEANVKGVRKSATAAGPIEIEAEDETGPAVESVGKRFSGLKAGLAGAGAAAGAVFMSGLAKNLNTAVLNDTLTAQLGLTTKTAATAGKAAAQVYGDNFGSSMEDVNDAIRAVGTNIADLSTLTQDEIKGMTEAALTYSSVMGKDVALSTEAVGSMLKNGLAKNATEAFDILTAGSQNGVDKADDLLETFQEYSPQFAKLGIDGKDALNLLSSGLKAGARDTDVIADAFKEFSIRSIDGTALTAQGFKAAGLNAKEMGERIGQGGESARKALQDTLEGLMKIEDPQKQNIAGTALFGTQWEDTVRQILPALADTGQGIQDVDGATQAMADTIGGNAQAKIDTMKRGLEQWTQSMAASDSQVGLLATGVANFGEQGLMLAANLGTVAVAFKALGVAMLANPFGITVLAILAVAAALAVLWVKSETAREVITTVFSAMADAIITYVKVILKAAQLMALGVLDSVGKVIHAVAMVPGPTQDAAKKAAKHFDDFREGVDSTFNKVQDKLSDYQKTVRNMPKKIKLQADERDLQAKLKHSQEQMRKLPKSKRTAFYADITNAERNIARIQAKLRGIRDRYVNVFVSEVQRDNVYGGHHVGQKATGGIIGAATGGNRGGLVMVGEHGRELVRLPYGSQVMPNGATENQMKANGVAGDDGVIRIVIEGTGVLAGLRKEIRYQGGNVQTVLGKPGNR